MAIGALAATPTDWALGIEARVRALLGEGKTLKPCIGSPSNVSVAPASAWNWPARTCSTASGSGEQRRLEARGHLRTAQLFRSLGAQPWLTAAASCSPPARPPANAPSTLDQLTAQEIQIARLVANGLTNPEIASQLFLSPRTVE